MAGLVSHILTCRVIVFDLEKMKDKTRSFINYIM